jgi:apolipoprotein N-acyltransferase
MRSRVLFSAARRWTPALRWAWQPSHSWWRLFFWGILASVAHPAGLSQLAPLLFGLSIMGLLHERTQGYPHRKMFAWGFLLGLGHLAWMATPDFVGPWCLAAAPLLSAAIGLQWLCWGHFLAARPTHLGCLALGGLWALLEWSREWWLSCGLGFGSLSALMVDWPIARNLAGLFGHFGLSWWIVSCTLLLYYHRVSPRSVIWLVIPWIYGLGAQCMQVPHIRVSTWLAAIQTGLFPGPGSAGPLSAYISIQESLDRLRPSAKRDCRILVMPESAIRIDLDLALSSGSLQYTLRDFYKHWACRLNAHLIVGADWVDDYGFRTGQIFLGPDGKEGRYPKRKLVFGAEYVPYDFLKPLLRSFGISESYVPGSESLQWPVGPCSIAPSVCYESAFAGLTRELVHPHTGLLVSSINDGWYPYSGLNHHHAAASRLRAIELGCPVLQAGHTGWTGLWDAYGNELCSVKRQGPFRGIAEFEGILERHSTPWSCWGLRGFHLAVALVGLGWVWQHFQLGRRIKRFASGYEECTSSN